MLVIAVVGIHVWVGCLPVKEMKSCWAFSSTSTWFGANDFMAKPRSFPRKLNMVGLVRETESGQHGLNILVYLGCMMSEYCTWPKSMLTTRIFLSPWWCILWNLVWKEFLLFCMTSFSQIQKKSNAFFPKSFKQKSFNVFFQLNLPFLGVWEKNWMEFIRDLQKKMVRIQDGMAMNYHVIENGKASPRVRKLNHWKVRLLRGNGTFSEGMRGFEMSWHVFLLLLLLGLLSFFNDGIWWFTRSPVLCFRKLQI